MKIAPLINLSVAIGTEDRKNTVRFIEEVMRKRFLCEPPPTNGVIVNAKSNGRLVGTMAVESTVEENPFVLELLYGCKPSFCRAKTVVGTRWIAIQTGVSHLVFSAAARLARDFGKAHMVIEAKPYAVNRLRSFGIPCNPIEGAELDLEQVRKYVREDGMAYYRTHPSPCLYILSIEEIVQSYP
ncbi:MAG: hypothetical protein JWN64_797 [Parcubacteria group bacterium]|nr:hypothetical protein [Parcubacteria group bacterium]